MLNSTTISARKNNCSCWKYFLRGEESCYTYEFLYFYGSNEEQLKGYKLTEFLLTDAKRNCFIFIIKKIKNNN